jgi:hypothetical protein
LLCHERFNEASLPELKALEEVPGLGRAYDDGNVEITEI